MFQLRGVRAHFVSLPVGHLVRESMAITTHYVWKKVKFQILMKIIATPGNEQTQEEHSSISWYQRSDIVNEDDFLMKAKGVLNNFLLINVANGTLNNI